MHIELNQPDIRNFVNICLQGGGQIMFIDYNEHNPLWPGYCNPSIMWDNKTKDFKLILRNVNYVLHNSGDNERNWCGWGPCFYSIPQEDGRNLKTRNFIGVSKDPFNNGFKFLEIQTKPYNPIWEFQGEEDARIIRWDDKLYTTGVRRDDNEKGMGRMELMLLKEPSIIADNKTMEYYEESRLKINGIGDNSTYCEKNWMPIQDIPYHYIQSSNPLRIIKVNPDTGEVSPIIEKPKDDNLLKHFDMLRGSSQCIPWKDGHITLVHTCELWFTRNGRKFAKYMHVFLWWDNDWNLKKVSPLFTFGDFMVEFTTGLEYHDGYFYIPFAIQDNFTYLLKVPENTIETFLDSDLDILKKIDNESCIEYFGEGKLFDPNITPEEMYSIAWSSYNKKDFAKAYCIFVRFIDKFPNHNLSYNSCFMAARLIADLSHRDRHEISMWMKCIQNNPKRPEAYFAAAMFYRCRGMNDEAFYFAEQGMGKLKTQKPWDENQPVFYNTNSMEDIYWQCVYDTEHYEYAVSYLKSSGKEIEEERKVL